MADLTDHLAGLDAAGVAAFFHERDALEITEMIRDASDAELATVLGDDTVRTQGIGAILARFHEFAEHDRLVAVKGVVAFELTHAGSPTETHVARFDGGEVTLEPSGSVADVTISADPVRFVRLVTGQANAALLYLADKIGVRGDGVLALDVGSVFRLPATGERAVDPKALDAVDVATAIKGVSRDHLSEVMGGDFREIVIGEVFRRMPDFIDEQKAGRQRLAIGFRVNGRPDGGADRYVAQVAQGRCSVVADPDSEVRRDATILFDGPEFLRVVLGHLNPVRALVSGQLKLKGDKAKALAFNAMMHPPKAR